jgi:hypothetical protein
VGRADQPSQTAPTVGRSGTTAGNRDANRATYVKDATTSERASVANDGRRHADMVTGRDAVSPSLQQLMLSEYEVQERREQQQQQVNLTQQLYQQQQASQRQHRVHELWGQDR